MAQGRCTGHCCRSFTINHPHGDIPALETTTDEGFTISHMLRPLGIGPADPRLGREEIFPPRSPVMRYTCQFLTVQGDCAIYAQRPTMCRSYPENKPCEYAGCTAPGP